jgi:hypothetical protein
MRPPEGIPLIFHIIHIISFIIHLLLSRIPVLGGIDSLAGAGRADEEKEEEEEEGSCTAGKEATYQIELCGMATFVCVNGPLVYCFFRQNIGMAVITRPQRRQREASAAVPLYPSSLSNLQTHRHCSRVITWHLERLYCRGLYLKGRDTYDRSPARTACL